MTHMEKVDIAYAAGLFDGEGCITTLWPSRKQLRIEIQMCHKPTLEKFVSIVGVGSVKKSYEKRKNHRTQWRWRVSDKNALIVLKLILPYLCEKHFQAKNGIFFKDCKSDSGKEYHANIIKSDKKLAFD